MSKRLSVIPNRNEGSQCLYTSYEIPRLRQIDQNGSE
jgi:hypothetical protein